MNAYPGGNDDRNKKVISSHIHLKILPSAGEIKIYFPNKTLSFKMRRNCPRLWTLEEEIRFENSISCCSIVLRPSQNFQSGPAFHRTLVILVNLSRSER